MPLTKLNAFTKKVADLADKPNATMTATQVKAQFDAAPDELRISFNALIDVLKATTAGDSGAKNIGTTAIVGLTGSEVQTLLESLKTLVDGKANSTDVYTITQLLSTTAGSSGAKKIGATPIATSPSDVQGILEWLKSQIDTTVLGQIPDGALTDAKLSNASTEIKQQFATHKADYLQFKKDTEIMYWMGAI